jgi:methylisocitrate lyase
VTPNLSSKELEKLGFRMVVFPLSALYSSTYAIKNVLLSLKQTGMTKTLKNKMITFNEFNDFVNLPKYNQLEEKYSSL